MAEGGRALECVELPDGAHALPECGERLLGDLRLSNRGGGDAQLLGPSSIEALNSI
jgi:hypothetical protein